MYNLLVSGLEEKWTDPSSSITIDRFGEYTSESLKTQYQTFSPAAIEALTSFPTLFAYEKGVDSPARLGRISRIAQPSGRDLRFEIEFTPGVKPIPAAKLAGLAWDLDLQEWEMNRTHWAIKDVDLLGVLTKARLLRTKVQAPSRKPPRAALADSTEPWPVRPTVFSLPKEAPNPRLVAVMMPFSPKFDSVYTAIMKACAGVDLECHRADKIWEDSAIIQDVFRLIYRSAIVVADLTKTNPNVLYEVGISHTLGRHVVPIAQKPLRRPFDVAHHRILTYSDTPAGLRALRAKLMDRLKYLAA